MAEDQDILAHCINGKHHSGCLFIFVGALLLFGDGIGVTQLVNAYIQLRCLHPRDKGPIYRVWRKSGLWQLVGPAKEDPEIQSLTAQIRARMIVDAMDSQRVKGSGREQHGTKQPSESQSTQIPARVEV